MEIGIILCEVGTQILNIIQPKFILQEAEIIYEGE
jgi:hypothetical protein